jgi:CDP-diglyceride synthetase
MHKQGYVLMLTAIILLALITVCQFVMVYAIYTVNQEAASAKGALGTVGSSLAKLFA